MSKDTINVIFENEEYEIDMEKARELGLLKSKNRLTGKKLEEYWHIDGYGTVQYESDTNDKVDDELFKLCNYFSTEEEAQLASDKTFDIWFKIRSWAIRNDTIKEFNLGDVMNYIYYDSGSKRWFYSSTCIFNTGETFMSEEGCKKLCKILNEGNYKI